MCTLQTVYSTSQPAIYCVSQSIHLDNFEACISACLTPTLYTLGTSDPWGWPKIRGSLGKFVTFDSCFLFALKQRDFFIPLLSPATPPKKGRKHLTRDKSVIFPKSCLYFECPYSVPCSSHCCVLPQVSLQLQLPSKTQCQKLQLFEQNQLVLCRLRNQFEK